MGYLFFLALIAALGGLLFGYDTAVISGTIDQVNTQYHLDVVQQAALLWDRLPEWPLPAG